MPFRILVVDDNRETLRTYVKALLYRIKPKLSYGGSLGETSISPLEVQEADSVSLAIEKLNLLPFDILIVDLKIPGISGEEMGGLELISTSMRLDPLRQIIAVTGYGSVQLARATLTKGVFDFIEKSGTATNELVDAVQRAIDSRNEHIIRSGNPFTPMSTIEPTVFGGRTAELKFFEQRLDRAIHTRFFEHFLVLGKWGIGKSTLLKEYKKFCKSRGCVSAIVPLVSPESGDTPSEACRSIAGGISRDLQYLGHPFKELVESINSIKINVLGSGLGVGRTTPKEECCARDFLHDFLIKLWEELKNKTEVLVILLDDLDNLGATPELLMTLKQTLSMDSIKETKILIGMTSTPTHWFRLTSAEKHNPLSRFFISKIELAPLSEAELRDTTLKSLAGTGISFSPEVISRVYEYTEGHPFEMQVLCYHLFNNQSFGRVDVDIWDNALEAAVNQIGFGVFEHWLSKASAEEAKVLRAVAEAETPKMVREIQDIMVVEESKVSLQNVAKYLQRLTKKGLLTKSKRGSYLIQDRMFRSYVHGRPK